MNLLEHTTVDCPYCGEAVSVSVDCSAGTHDFIEDCTVCCRPIELCAEINASRLIHVTARRDDE